MSFMQVQCGGRLVRDPEVSYTNSGMAICKFSLAIDRPKKQGQAKAEADFFNFVAFAKQAELIGNNFGKGSFILITKCRPQNNEYTTKNGDKRKDTQFIIDSFEFVGNGSKKTIQQSSFESMGTDVDVPF